MNNKLKLSAQRYYDVKENEDVKTATFSTNELSFAFESDRGRVLNSAAVRRLQQKTQVFPLEKNSAVRSRLTHSLEVMQVGRFIVQSICKQANANKTAASYKLPDISRELETLVEMACVLHDVGNPPFGHFGEHAISQWFATNALNAYKINNKQALTVFEESIFKDLCHFEGNAQAIRLVHSLMNLNLTNSLVAAILKYTRCGTQAKPPADMPLSYLHKKVGYYYSEKALVAHIHTSLNTKAGHRYPATYIMEAADDISYCMADLEDAVEKGIIKVKQLKDALIAEYAENLSRFGLSTGSNETLKAFFARKGYSNDHRLSYSEVPPHLKMAYICHDAMRKYKKEDIRKQNAFFIQFRVGIVHPLVSHATARFIDNIDAVVAGNFNQALLEDKSYEHALSQTLKNVALHKVFCVKEVETIELQGYQILHGLLDKFGTLLNLTAGQFKDVCSKGAQQFPLESRLVKRIGKKHRATYLQAINALQNKADEQEGSFSVMEYYYRCRLIQDHVSGMTDQFALDEYQVLHVL